MTPLEDVVIVGGGPVGVLLAAELARHGVSAAVIERRRADAASEADPAAAALRTRAVGVHATTLAAMEPSGATDRLLAHARRVHEGEARRAGRTLGVVRFDRLRTRHPYVATLPQPETEAAVAETAADWGAPAPDRGVAVTALAPHGDRVDVRLADGTARAARIVVVAGGVRARGLLPLAARMRRYPDRYLMTDCTDNGPDGDRAVVHLDARGVLESFPLPAGRRRYVAWVGPGDDGAPADRLREAVATRTASDAAASAVGDATAFGVARSGLAAMRSGRLIAIGDTAHEVSPIGGQGMNLGLIDAVTLAPLLARWVRAESRASGRAIRSTAPGAGVGAGRSPATVPADVAGPLAAWERARLAAASRAGRIAGVNTALGRPARPVAVAGVRAALATPAAGLLARAYAMGFDPGARLFEVPR